MLNAGSLSATGSLMAAGSSVASPLKVNSSDAIEFAFGQIRHTRLTPKKHAFSYPGFYLRVPIHNLDQCDRGNFLFGLNRTSLTSFHSRDHGPSDSVGTKQPDLLLWIRDLLEKEQIIADGAIWLHTFSRVWGYQFKPVSFWFCHASSGALVAIIAEVKNTFGEQHLYLLRNPEPNTEIKWGTLLNASKNFHVSPFFKVEGRYEFRFFNRSDRSVARVDYFINDTIALQTSLSGQHQNINNKSALKALLSYPAFSLGVVARIHWHALRLWAQKRIPFITKPSPPKTLITYGEP
jgi:uncharacterized protein